MLKEYQERLEERDDKNTQKEDIPSRYISLAKLKDKNNHTQEMSEIIEGFGEE